MLRFLPFVILGFSGFSKEVIEYSTGVAKNKNGQVVYVERHESKFVSGRLKTLTTKYSKSQSGDIFGGIESDFSKSDTVPEYLFKDEQHNRSAGVTWLESPNQVEVFAEKKGNKKVKQFDIQPSMVAGQGLYNYLRIYSKELVDEPRRVREIQFLVPFKKAVYSFQVRTKAYNPKTGVAVFRIEADSWLFRLMAPHIDATYDINKKRLLVYEGPSNLLDPKGKSMGVIINYSYSGQKFLKSE